MSTVTSGMLSGSALVKATEATKAAETIAATQARRGDAELKNIDDRAKAQERISPAQPLISEAVSRMAYEHLWQEWEKRGVIGMWEIVPMLKAMLQPLPLVDVSANVTATLRDMCAEGSPEQATMRSLSDSLEMVRVKGAPEDGERPPEDFVQAFKYIVKLVQGDVPIDLPWIAEIIGRPLDEQDVARLHETLDARYGPLFKTDAEVLAALWDLRSKAGEEGEAAKPLRAALDSACTRQVAINGIFEMFKIRMLDRSDEPEPW